MGWFTDIFEEVGDFVEETFLPEEVKDVISDIPIVGDAISRGWLGPVIQQFTDEGKEAFTKGTGTAGVTKTITEILGNIATAMAIPGALGAEGGIFGSGMTLPGFGGGEMTQLFSSLEIPGFGTGGMFNPYATGIPSMPMGVSDPSQFVNNPWSLTEGSGPLSTYSQGGSVLADSITKGGGMSGSGIWDLLSNVVTGGGQSSGIDSLSKIIQAVGNVAGIFQKPKTETIQETAAIPGWQEALGQNLAGWANTYMPYYMPGLAYPGPLTAGKTPLESKGLEFLNKYLDQGTGALGTAAQNELLKTLSGSYDPRTSPFYAPTREAMNYEIQDAIDQANRGAGYRGSFFQSTAQSDTNRIRERGVNYMNQLLGQMAETERQNRFKAVEPAFDMEKYNAALPLAKAAGALDYGSLDRTLHQSDLEAQYNEWIRQRGEVKEPINVAQGVFGSQVPMGITSYNVPVQSSFERIMSQIPGAVDSAKTIWDIFKPKTSTTLTLA